MRLGTALCVLLALVPLSLAESYNSTDGSRLETQIGTSRVSSYTLPRWRGTAESFSSKDVPIPLPEVPEGALSFLSNFTTAEYGSSGVPFTTSGAYGSIKDLNSANLPTVLTPAPSDLRPWSATGKLSWDFGWCSASMIAPNIAVTAAHCVSDFGQGFYSGTAYFIASQFGSNELYRAPVLKLFAPTTYLDGSDVCDVVGVVCENDVAIMVLGGVQSPPSLKDMRPGNAGGYYNYSSGDYSYVTFGGAKRTQMTAMGYPGNLDSGARMTRTDSVGTQETPNQVVIGSSMKGGSSGGPWIVNFGMSPVYTGSSPGVDSRPNSVMATTSWGYTSDAYKLQGASRFATNTAFPVKSNIQSLVDSYCCGLDSQSRADQCGTIAVCPDTASPVIALNAQGSIFYNPDISVDQSGSWDSVYGKLVDASISMTKVLGTNTAGQIYYTPNIDNWASFWRPVPGAFKQVAISGTKAVAVDSSDIIYYTSNIEAPSWTTIPGRLQQIAISGSRVVGVNSRQDVYYAPNVDSVSWIKLPGKMVQVAISGTKVVGVDSSDLIYYMANVDAPSWTTIPGRLRQIAISGSRVIGANSRQDVYYAPNVDSVSWIKLPGKMAQVAISDTKVVGADPSDRLNYMPNVDAPSWSLTREISKYVSISDTRVVGTTSAGQAFYTPNIANWDSFWRQIPGKLKQGAISGTKTVGVTSSDVIYYTSNIEAPSWIMIPGRLRQIAISGSRVIGVNAKQDVYYAPNVDSVSWIKLPGKMVQVAISGTKVVGVDSSDKIYYMANVDAPSWTTIAGTLRQIAISGSRVIGVTSAQDVYYAPNVDSVSWTQIPGKMVQVAITSI